MSQETTARCDLLRGTLTITLKSDLCAASGEGFSNGIDVDVCHDARGLPTIPGRRLKGCLREAAELVYGAVGDNADRIAGLFGVQGSGEAGWLRVGTAVPGTDYDGMVSALETAGFDPQDVLGAYTYLRAQTAINNDLGTADDGTLRVTRVVKHLDPLGSGNAELVFRAPVDLAVDASDEHETAALRTVLANAARAMRNIGYGRNHGLGAVRCEIEFDGNAESRAFGNAAESQASSERIRISYRVRLDDPLMISAASGNESCPYVPGTSVLGFFASRLRLSSRFDDLFLRSKVSFSPLYPVDAALKRCTPATPLVVKIKSGTTERDGEYRHALNVALSDGEAAKPVDRAFLDSNSYPTDPVTEIVYHHSRQGDGELYTQRCLSEGQELAGFIDGPADILEEVLAVLAHGTLSFGRSKTAQYSRCSLVEKPRVSACEESRISLKVGDPCAIVLDSDTLILDGLGRFKTDLTSLGRAVEDALQEAGVEPGVLTYGTESLEGLTRLSRKALSGYNAKWNHKKPHVPAIAAGSCVAFTPSRDVELPEEFFIGERQAEGLGRVIVMRVSEDAGPLAPATPKREGNAPEREGLAPESPPIVAHLRSMRESEGERLRAIRFAKGNSKALTGLSKSFIGRLTLMAKESRSEQDLFERIDSVKSDDKRKAARKIVTMLLDGGDAESGAGSSAAQGAKQGDWAQRKGNVLVVLELAKLFAKQEDDGDAANAASTKGGDSR